MKICKEFAYTATLARLGTGMMPRWRALRPDTDAVQEKRPKRNGVFYTKNSLAKRPGSFLMPCAKRKYITKKKAHGKTKMESAMFTLPGIISKHRRTKNYDFVVSRAR